MMTNPDVLRMIEILAFRAHPEPLRKKQLRHWFESEEPNVIGAAVDAVLRHSEHIEPALTRREVGDVLMKNFGVSLRSRGEKLSIYAYTCHEAAKEFYGWMIASYAALPDAEAEESLRVGKHFLEQSYRVGNEGQRNCLIAGAIEHIFEVDGLYEMFSDWKEDADLFFAFTKAEEWRGWVAARVRAVEPVVRRAAEILRSRGYEEVVIKRPAVGTTMPVIAWNGAEQNELVISSDEEWVEAMRANAIDIENASTYAADPENWTHSSYAPTHFTVELNTQPFMTPRS